jgi:hypothetical protein
MRHTQLQSFPYFLGLLIFFYLDSMCLWAENDLSTSQDVTRAYFNREIFSGAMPAGDLHLLH